MTIKAPFPYFGGKSRVAARVWERFGDVRNYVEPFAGSLAVLLGRPLPFAGTETVNDADGLLSNFWRAVQADPDAVSQAADWPVNENDLHARHAWLVGHKEQIQARLEGDPAWFDAQAAGWWCWGLCLWIGSGWCSGHGPWHVVNGELVKTGAAGGNRRQLPHLGDAGRGVKRQRPHLGHAVGVNRQLPHLGDAGRGVNRQLPHLGDAGQGVNRQQIANHRHWQGVVGHRVGSEALYAWMQALAGRLRRVRVCCGDWSRVCGPTPTVKQGLTAVFLDPPYSTAERDGDLYSTDSGTVAAEVRDWAVANGDNPLLRIALCGYAGEHEMPDDWSCVAWKSKGGYGSQGNGRGRANSGRERVWLSPRCLVPAPVPQEQSP